MSIQTPEELAGLRRAGRAVAITADGGLAA
jgi:hypothetical protein